MKKVLVSLMLLAVAMALTGCDVVMYPVSQAIMAHDKAQNEKHVTFTIHKLPYLVDIHETYANYPSRQIFKATAGQETVYLYCTATFVTFPVAGEKEYTDCPALPVDGTVTLKQTGAGGPWILDYKTPEGYSAYSALNLTDAKTPPTGFLPVSKEDAK